MTARPIAVSLCAFALLGCFPSKNPQTLQERTADATAAARNAAGQIAAGVFQGMVRKPAKDLNTASASDLAKLPGMNAALARAIVRSRPYSRTDELVSRGIITRPQFDRLRAQVKVSAGAAASAAR